MATLAAGARLGPYEIVAPLGAGGMGEVYRARDPRLNRAVALKLLPPSLARDADRLRRFAAEAEAVGAIQHPAIVSVFDVGEHNGSPFMVMELLEGESLRDRLDEGPLAPRRALECALVVAQGLAAAHERGVVHRDLKPENLYLTRAGGVKILDFGLAKLREEKAIAEGTSYAATRAAGATTPGAILGTVGYMAPEQVRGLAADSRSDIFALGAVIYETLTGLRAFRGGSAVESMSAILKDDPPDISQSGARISPAVDRIVRRCLEKEPENRFQSARDLAFALEAVSGTSGPIDVPEGTFAPSRRTPKRAYALAAGVGVAALAIGWLVGAATGGRSTPPPAFRQVTFRDGMVANARFAPDGHTIVYTAGFRGSKPDTYTARDDTAESRALGLDRALLLGVSHNGEMALLVSSPGKNGSLARLPLGGGTPRPVLDGVQFADWSPDGRELAVVRPLPGRMRLEYPAGHTLYETPGAISYARISPRGNLVAFLDHPIRDDNRGAVCVVDSAGKKRELSAGWMSLGGLAFSPDGAEVWFTGTRMGLVQQLVAVTLDGRERVMQTAPTSLRIEDVRADGAALLASYSRHMRTVCAREGKPAIDVSVLDLSLVTDMSEDGSSVLILESGEGGGPGYTTYLARTDGTPPMKLSEGAGMSLSPDGAWVLVGGTKDASQLAMVPTGAGERRAITIPGLKTIQWARFSRDGRHLLVIAAQGGEGTRAFLCDLDGSNLRPVTPVGIQGGRNLPAMSPDGKAIVCGSPERVLTVYPLDGSAPKPLRALEAGEALLRYDTDGSGLILGRVSDGRPRLYRYDLATSRTAPLFESPEKTSATTPPAGIESEFIEPQELGGTLVTADGKQVCATLNRVRSTLYLATGLK